MIFDPRKFNRDDPKTWPWFKPTIIAHDVARSRDRSTAVIGGTCQFQPGLLGLTEFIELPQGLCGHALASELAKTDRCYGSDALIIVDLSNDPTYAEVLFEMFGPRVIFLHITRSGEGMKPERRAVKGGVISVYTIGRSYLLDHLLRKLEAKVVRFADGPESRRAYAQLEALETEMRDTGIVYNCLPGQHDDLAISCAMLVWAAGHPDLPIWFRPIEDARRPRRPRSDKFGWGAFVRG